MEPAQLLASLTEAMDGDRNLDIALARFFGWSKDNSGNESADQKVTWLSPSGERTNRAPSYTTDLDWGYRLALEQLGDLAVAMSWQDGACKVSIQGIPTVEGRTLATTLCAAILSAKLVRHT